MLDWHSCQICYPLEIKILLLLSGSHYVLSYAYGRGLGSFSAAFYRAILLPADY